jgi:hypothetical protein
MVLSQLRPRIWPQYKKCKVHPHSNCVHIHGKLNISHSYVSQKLCCTSTGIQSMILSYMIYIFTVRFLNMYSLKGSVK